MDYDMQPVFDAEKLRTDIVKELTGMTFNDTFFRLIPSIFEVDVNEPPSGTKDNTTNKRKHTTILDTLSGYDVSFHVEVYYKCSVKNCNAKMLAKRYDPTTAPTAIERPEGWSAFQYEIDGKKVGGLMCPAHDAVSIQRTRKSTTNPEIKND